MEDFFYSPRTERYVRVMHELALATEYISRPLGDSMLLVYHKNWHTNKERLLVCCSRQRVYPLVDSDGKFELIEKEDIDFDGICHLKNIKNAHRLKVDYEFEIDQFTNSMALARWQLYPDSHWFDDQGLGITDNAETSIYAYINEYAQLMCKFTDMRFEYQCKEIKRQIKWGNSNKLRKIKLL